MNQIFIIINKSRLIFIILNLEFILKNTQIMWKKTYFCCCAKTSKLMLFMYVFIYLFLKNVGALIWFVSPPEAITFWCLLQSTNSSFKPTPTVYYSFHIRISQAQKSSIANVWYFDNVWLIKCLNFKTWNKA